MTPHPEIDANREVGGRTALAAATDLLAMFSA
jgi:hypothetical protein